MTQRATVHDFEPAQFRRKLRDAGEALDARGVFSDMTDGAAVMQLFFNFAGFEWKETKIFLPVAELCGDAGVSVSLYDDELAEHARCTDRTVRNWRRDYLARAATVSFHPLEIAEGEYDAVKQRYERTGYTVAPAVAEAVEQAVAEARVMPDYSMARMSCLERAARIEYDGIPDAPAKKDRARRPKKSLQPQVKKSFESARKSLGKGRRALLELGERRRAALLAGQGEELREVLLAMRGEIDELLSEISEDIEEKEVNDMPEKLSGIPPDERERGDAFRVEDKNTRKPPDEPEPEHSPEAVAAFDALTRKLTAPRVRSVEVELRVVPDAIPNEKAIHTRVAELVRAKQITGAEGMEFKSKAHDTTFRREFAERYMTGGAT
jgi:PAS domain-containing protein